MERVWGGNKLQNLLGKSTPHDARIGEAWEIVDREEAQSVVRGGALKGATLHELWTSQRVEVFGTAYAGHSSSRFPLLFKLLDAEERLSVQVHPPATLAAKLHGEPKTEMWFILATAQDEAVFAGVTPGTTRADFEAHLQAGTVEEIIQRVPVRAGDAIFIPSGRLHAIGAGNLIVEVQQNSDTTYRVFDWNRLGLDGQPRALHIAESLASIDFTDTDPQLAQPDGETGVRCEYFQVERWALETQRPGSVDGRFAIYTVLSGSVDCAGESFKKGEFFLVPASLGANTLTPQERGTSLLRTTIPSPSRGT